MTIGFLTVYEVSRSAMVGKSNPLVEVPVQLFYYVQVVFFFTNCLQMLHMCNSIRSPIFSDFKSDLSRVAGSRPLVNGNEDAGCKGGFENEFYHMSFLGGARDGIWGLVFFPTPLSLIGPPSFSSFISAAVSLSFYQSQLF